MIEIMKQVANGNVKVTPDVLVANDNAAGNGGMNASLGLVPALLAKLVSA